jgi:hypothetical protein
MNIIEAKKVLLRYGKSYNNMKNKEIIELAIKLVKREF